MPVIGERHSESVDIWIVFVANDEAAQLLIGGGDKLSKVIISWVDGEIEFMIPWELDVQLVRVGEGYGSDSVID
jgi:hypothetical protein